MTRQLPDKPRVLIVDDDPEVLGSLVAWLEDRFDVLTATDGVDALAVLDRGAVDVIVLDLMMPNMDGATFKRALDARGLSVPVILASAAADVDRSARVLGAAGFVVKPIEIDELEAMIAQLAGGSGPGGGPAPGGGHGGRRTGSGGSSPGERSGRPAIAVPAWPFDLPAGLPGPA